jgi:hypothetical protein
VRAWNCALAHTDTPAATDADTHIATDADTHIVTDTDAHADVSTTDCNAGSLHAVV